MEKQLDHYEFINSQTGNVICYLTVPTDTSERELATKLQKKRAELAIKNNLYVELIYWQVEGHVIR
ncbi:hypothetical protein [Mucilaginibacter jinjuensis]|uniref:Uncharacterized protein n=1 Tax=Mucilaginibacter jinjuensis TaxID=1176721 RepID=A0ABY7T857_9SPHI|nr:hypothetical protein [Mucilaginibacter jinjuensis]WCT11862.1 hypothetical protein PQO05_24320 [Mucilaginibacter jinjuensis]